jgi:HEAT repeat protein
MPDDSYRQLRTLLASTDPADLNRGLELAAIEISKAGIDEARPLLELLSGLFYIDAYDRPELLPAVNKALDLIVGFGSKIIPFLVEYLDAGDIKAQWAVANILGRIGAESVEPLIAAYVSTTNATLRAFILYALGKVKSPEVLHAIGIALDAAQSLDLELRDTATRALGKFVESIPPASLSKEQKRQFIECLRGNLSDPNASVRSKAIRGLGKMARYGCLTDSERKQLDAVCRHILGADADGDWDRAFIVRKEAEEALRYV